MKYKNENWVINDLIELFNSKNLNLNPPYQRNDIWPTLSKKRLIESVKLGYPLPSFFLYHKENGFFEMVDGQQRTRCFIGYQKGFFTDTLNESYQEEDKLYSTYKINICIIETESDEVGVIEDFYYRVNKFGVKLNRPEIKRAEFSETVFQGLIEKLSTSIAFKQLALFSEKSMERLNDFDFISELLTLINYGITEKKIFVDKLYKKSPEEFDLSELEIRFNEIIQIICDLDGVYTISKTRYRQRNDFYTLFNFLLYHQNEIEEELLIYQYKMLVLIGEDIFPTNEKCWSFLEYATNCVSQSNSKRARHERLSFFENLLLNKEQFPLLKFIEGETPELEVITDTINFYGIQDIPLVNISGYYLIDIKEILKLKQNYTF